MTSCTVVGKLKKAGCRRADRIEQHSKCSSKRSLFPLFYILHLELSEGISLKILFPKRVFGFDTQEKNLSVFYQSFKH